MDYGTTAAVVLMSDGLDPDLVVANVGDNRCLLIEGSLLQCSDNNTNNNSNNGSINSQILGNDINWTFRQITRDHGPIIRSDEVERVREAGGNFNNNDNDMGLFRSNSASDITARGAREKFRKMITLRARRDEKVKLIKEKKKIYFSIHKDNERETQNNLIQNRYEHKSQNYLFWFQIQQRHCKRYKQGTDCNTNRINTNNNNRSIHDNDVNLGNAQNMPALLQLVLVLVSERQRAKSSPNISNQTGSDIVSITKSGVFSCRTTLSSSMRYLRINHAKSMYSFEADDSSPTPSLEQVYFSSFTRKFQISRKNNSRASGDMDDGFPTTDDSEYYGEFCVFANKMCSLHSNRYSDKKTMRKQKNDHGSDNDVSDDESSIIALKTDFVLKLFGDLTPEDAVSCLRDILQYGANLQLLVQVAKRYSDFLTTEKLISLFEEFESWSAFSSFLGSKVKTTQDSNVIFKYIQVAYEVRQYAQVELICRENNYYDPEEVKTLLIEANKVQDSRTLIHVCDRHGFKDELTNHLYTNQLYKFIEVYVTRMNPHATLKVVGTLLDSTAPEHQIRNLMNSVRPVEKRIRITLLLPWLEARFHEGLEYPELHNALAKNHIDVKISLSIFNDK